MEALPLTDKISVQSQRTAAQRILINQAGDGFEERIEYGVNSRYDQFNISWNNLTLDERNDWVDFYETVQLVNAFSWTPLDLSAGTFIFTQAPVETNNGDFYNFQAQIKQVFGVIE